jgi:predicted ATP-grasp superfamily ATP-dependent carboligase
MPTVGAVDALVTDAHSRAGVAGIRALGRAGVRVLSFASTRGAPGLRSRYARERAVGPPAGDGAAFVARIGALAAEHGPLVVYPGQEQALDPLTDHMHDLPAEAIVPYPGPEPLRALRHKPSLEALVHQAGLVVPDLLAEGLAGELVQAPPPAPCVVKSPGLSPALPVAKMTETAAELHALLESLPPDEPIIIQERAGGPLIGLAIVLGRDGEVVARFQQTADLLWPIGAGGSRRATSVAPDPELVDAAARLLRETGFWGLAQMQFMSARRGAALIDVNPRFYGSLPLATDAGVNLAAAWHAVALGERPPAESPYRVGVTYRWLEGEIAAAFNGARRELFAPAPRPRSGAMWAADDPVPSAMLAAEAAWARVARRLGR